MNYRILRFWYTISSSYRYRIQRQGWFGWWFDVDEFGFDINWYYPYTSLDAAKDAIKAFAPTDRKTQIVYEVRK